MAEFRSFSKIARLSREMIITEKIDGANGVIHIGEDGEFLVGNRSMWITPQTDGSGFAKWAYANKDELMRLGPGYHYGEWWGYKVQRQYGLTENRFSLFNVSRWTDDVRPACCHVVPVLYVGLFDTRMIQNVLFGLEMYGSKAAPGFMDPEGVVVFHVASGNLYKKTIKKDDQPKNV